MADAFELGRFIEVFFLVLGELLALHHLHEQAAQTARFLDRLARDQVGHHVGRRLADSAAMARERGFLDDAVFHAQLEHQLVAAAGVDALVLVGGAFQVVLVVGVRVVLHERRGVDVSH